MFDGTLKFDTKIDKSGFTVGIENLGSIAKKGLAVVSAASAAALAGVAAIGKQAVTTGADFRKGMSQVGATLGYSVDALKNSATEAYKNMEKLTAKAEEMGAKTAFSASQAADGLNILAQSGYNADESIEMINSVLDMAAAGNLSLDAAASYVAGSMKGFTREAGNFADKASASAYYADMIAKGATLANTNVQQLGEALSATAAIADSYGQSSTEAEVALLRLAEQNETGAAAATMLSAVMKNIYTPIDQAAAVFQELGFSAYDAAGQAKDFNQVVDELNSALNQKFGSNQEGKAAYIEQIFGIQGAEGFKKLITSSADTVQKFYDGVASAAGSAAQQAKTMLDNLAGDITIFGSAFDGFKIALFRNLDSPLRDAVQTATNYIFDLTKVLDEQGLDGLASALGKKIVGAFDYISGWLPKIAKTGVTFASSLGKELLSAFLNHLPDMAVTGAELLAKLASGIADGVPELIGSGDAALTKLSESMRKKNLRFRRLGRQILKSITKTLSENLPLLVDAFLNLIESAADMLNDSQNLSAFADAAVSILLALADGLISSVPILAEKAPEIIGHLVQAVKDNAGLIKDSGKKILEKLGESLKSAKDSLEEHAPEIMQNLVDALKEAPLAVGAVADAVISAIADALGLGDKWEKIKETISEKLEKIDLDDLKLKLNTELEVLSEKAETIKQKIAEKLGFSDFDELEETFRLNLEIAISDIPENIGTLLSDIKAFGEWVADYNDEGAQKFRASLEGIATAAGTFTVLLPIMGMLEKFGTFIQFGLPVMVANLPNLLAGISGSFAGLGTALAGIILSPAGLVAILAALAGAFVYVAKTSEEWQIGAQQIVDWEQKLADSYQKLIDAYARDFEKDEKNWNQFKDKMQEIWDFWEGFGEYLADNNPLDSIGEALDNFWSERLDDWTTGMDELLEKFNGWGADLITNFIDGMDSKLNPLHDAGTAIGEMLYDLFHHSTPETGYLKDDDEWMPDMMLNFSEGIRSNIPLVVGQAEELAGNLNAVLGDAVPVDFPEPEIRIHIDSDEMPEIPDIPETETKISAPEISILVQDIPEIENPEIIFDSPDIPEIENPELTIKPSELPELDNPELVFDVPELPELDNPELVFDVPELPELDNPELVFNMPEIPEFDNPELVFDTPEIPEMQISYLEIAPEDMPDLEILPQDVPEKTPPPPPEFPDFPDFPEFPEFPEMPSVEVPESEIPSPDIRLPGFPEIPDSVLQFFRMQNARMPDFFANLAGNSEIINNHYYSNSYQTTNQTMQNTDPRPVEATIYTTVELDGQAFGTAVKKVVIGENAESGGWFV